MKNDFSRHDIPDCVKLLLDVAEETLKMDRYDVYALAVKHGTDWKELADELCEIGYASRHEGKHGAVVEAAERVWSFINNLLLTQVPTFAEIAPPTSPSPDSAAAKTVDAILAVDLDAVPVVCTDRHINRKDQAKLARDLFKKLGIKGVSVTTPTYSMASSVDVRFDREPFSWEGFEKFENSTVSDMPSDVPCKRSSARHLLASNKLGEILAKAFPEHDDRSDSQSDHFDYKWSIR